MPKLELIDLFR